MSTLHKIATSIDAFTDMSGRLIVWLSLAMALLTALIVLLRYGFNIGSIAAQETVTYMHASLFMLGAAYTLKAESHVRVDIFYQRFGTRTRAWVNCLGGVIFLLPLCVFIFGISLDYVSESWAIRESSPEAGGIPGVYLLKTLMPLMAATLFIQGLSEVLKNMLVLMGEAS